MRSTAQGVFFEPVIAQLPLFSSAGKAIFVLHNHFKLCFAMAFSTVTSIPPTHGSSFAGATYALCTTHHRLHD
jgi:hypothetical protein